MTAKARSIPVRRIAILIAAVAVGVILWLVWRPRADDRPLLTGYIQAQELYLSSPVAGPVAKVDVERGQRVAAGAPLFTMDVKILDAGRAEAAARIAQARAQQTQQAAAAQQAAAQLVSARAQAAQAAADLARDEAAERDTPGAVARQQVEAARTLVATTAAQRDAAARAVDAIKAQIAAAQAQISQETAGLSQAQTQLDQLSARAPAAGRIEDVMFQTGEWAPANQPVVALIPDAKVKVRFYVPASRLGWYVNGRAIRFSCDGCDGQLTAHIDFVSPTPEYTPPIIYSLKMREKLVFMIEARPDDPSHLSPGQPVDVEPLGGPERDAAR